MIPRHQSGGIKRSCYSFICPSLCPMSNTVYFNAMATIEL